MTQPLIDVQTFKAALEDGQLVTGDPNGSEVMDFDTVIGMLNRLLDPDNLLITSIRRHTCISTFEPRRIALVSVLILDPYQIVRKPDPDDTHGIWYQFEPVNDSDMALGHFAGITGRVLLTSMMEPDLLSENARKSMDSLRS